MINNKTPIEVAFDFFTEHTKGATLVELWNQIVHSISWNTDDKTKAIADLFTGLVLDQRFVFLSGNKWNIKENLTKKDEVLTGDYPNPFADLDQATDLSSTSDVKT